MDSESLQTTSLEPQVALKRKLRIVLGITDVVATVFWSYLVVHVFIFDVDILIRNLSIPYLDTAFQYKWLVLAGFFALVFAVTRNIWSLSIAGYVALFPLVVVCWKIPRLLWKTKSPLITLAFLNAIFSFFRSIRYNLASVAALIFFSGIVFVSNSYYFVVGAIFGLLSILVIIYLNRLRIVLRPSVLYEVHARAISFFSNSFQKTYKLDVKLQPFALARVPKELKSEILGNLQFLMIINRGAYFLSAKLREFHRSNVRVLFYLFNLLILIFTTAYIFAVANFGLWRVSPDSFQVSDARFFSFVYYSFSSVFGRGVIEIIPLGDFPKFLAILQIIFSFFVLAIIVTLVFSLQSKRDEEGIETAIEKIRSEGEAMDLFISSEYKMTGDQVVEELEKAKVILIRLIYYFTRQ